MKLIGFAGPAGSGKTTAALHLVDTHNFHRIRFAETLKKMLYALGLNQEHIDGSRKEEAVKILCGKTPRYAMQTLGTEWGRQLIGPDIWVNAWEHAVKTCGKQSIVVDDVRFENEVKIIHQLGGKIFVIDRAESTGYKVIQGSGHASETYCAPGERISNVSSIRHFHENIDVMLNYAVY